MYWFRLLKGGDFDLDVKESPGQQKNLQTQNSRHCWHRFNDYLATFEVDGRGSKEN